MSLSTLRPGKWIPLHGTVLETPLMDVPYPPVNTTPVEAYGISGLTKEFYDAMCNFFQELDLYNAIDLNPWLELKDAEYVGIGMPERQILLHLFEQHTDRKGVYVRDAYVNRIFIAPLDEFEDKQMLVVAGYTNLCLEPLHVEHRRMMNGSWDENCTLLPTNVGVAPRSTPGKKHLSSPSLPAALKPKIPRPANEWILYRADNHLPIKKAYPGITNNEISSIIAGMWAAETPDRRLKYKIRADMLKEAHKKAYPTYKYAPRKPGEKKRRASKKTLTKPITNQLSHNFNTTTSSITYPTPTHNSIYDTGLDAFGLNVHMEHTNTVEQQLQPEHSRLTYADEATGMNFTPTDSWQMVQQQDLFTFFAHQS
ncbi:mating type protein MAT2 [Sclerotinia borealis F-4128]|uniref:Mating type protein MAT2 n=1 Tax=Sclerotinia borealis (strain F-4128) TaxID=1432307 RepID=W9C7I2_SCLBF|nr:mating type protein MAT2 [Sclerotinia borealis F-4128]